MSRFGCCLKTRRVENDAEMWLVARCTLIRQVQWDYQTKSVVDIRTRMQVGLVPWKSGCYGCRLI